MNRLLSVSFCACIACAMLFSGCAKKVTKMDTLPKPEPVAAAPAPVAAAPVERESFETVDPDAAIKEILQPVYFDYDQTDLRSETLERLQKIARLMEEKKSLNILMEGHADERGTNEYNIGLGQRRAKSIRDWLANFGIADGRLELTSFGRERPAFPSCDGDDACHAKNRRCEFKVLAK